MSVRALAVVCAELFSVLLRQKKTSVRSLPKGSWCYWSSRWLEEEIVPEESCSYTRLQQCRALQSISWLRRCSGQGAKQVLLLVRAWTMLMLEKGKGSPNSTGQDPAPGHPPSRSQHDCYPPRSIDHPKITPFALTCCWKLSHGLSPPPYLENFAVGQGCKRIFQVAGAEAHDPVHCLVANARHLGGEVHCEGKLDLLGVDIGSAGHHFLVDVGISQVLEGAVGHVSEEHP